MQIGALSDHYLLARRGRSSVSKRLAPKHTAALNADSRVSTSLILRSMRCSRHHHRSHINLLWRYSTAPRQRLAIISNI